MMITDEMIEQYCKRMNYKLISIERISFRYQKSDGSEAALLKAAAAHNQKFKSDACNCISGIPQTTGGCPMHGCKLPKQSSTA